MIKKKKAILFDAYGALFNAGKENITKLCQIFKIQRSEHCGKN